MQDIIFSVQLRLGKRKESVSEQSEKIEANSEVGGIEKWLNTAQQIVKSMRKK